MSIISISLNDNLVKEIGKLEKELGFSGRSEIIRAALRMLIASEKEKSKLTGAVEVVIIVVSLEKNAEDISEIRHSYNEIIKTQIHNHLESHKCLEIFVVKGEASRIVSLVNAFETSRKAEYVKLFVS